MTVGFLITGLVVFCISSCAKSVPPAKAAYVGLWKAPQMFLLITRDGGVRCTRIIGGVAKSIAGPIRAFNGNNFHVSVGRISTTFVVASPPHEDGGATKMTVDGVELIKS
jgi:hypothetical protein